MNKYTSRLKWLFLAVLAAAVLVYFLLPAPQPQARAQFSGLQQNAGDFEHARPGTQFSFPRDFGPKPDFQTEWWYYTGNLQTAQGRHFGYQLTFFRRALEGPAQRQPRTSSWAAEQVYMAHFTLTDVSGQQFRYFERFSRGAAGMAGASVDPSFRVWLEDWSVVQQPDGDYVLHASQDGITLDLTMRDLTGPILQGQQGYSQKGPGEGNASLYFSQPRLKTSGTVRVGGQNYAVDGLSWMDREISTSALAENEVGWDWFALQLDDGSSLMLYNLRREDGSLSPYSSAALIREDGSTRPLAQKEFDIRPAAAWRSPHTGAEYPSGWTVSVPSENIRLEVRPYLADQELRLSIVYWEGAVQVSGQRQGRPVSGSGYVELTGYSQSINGQF